MDANTVINFIQTLIIIVLGVYAELLRRRPASGQTPPTTPSDEQLTTLIEAVVEQLAKRGS